MQIFEAKILKFVIHRIQTEAVRDWRIDLKRFLCHAFLLGLRHSVERTHIMQAISKFDENHPNIPCHGQQHFSEVLGLCLFERSELQFIEFRNTIDKLRDGLTEFLRDIGFGCRRVFDHIMQQRCDQGLWIEMPLRQNCCDG